MPLDLKDSTDTAKEPRRFTLSLSPAGLVGAIGLLLVGLAWVFIIGVLVGRGYKPETAVPELARMMPGSIATAPDTAEKPSVLKAEDLQFYDDLSKKPAAQGKAEAPKTAAAPKAEAKKDAPKAGPTPEPAPKAVAKPSPPSPAPASPSADDAGADGDQAVYDYRYQVASVQDQASADAFRARLAGLGIQSDIEKAEVNGKTWLRILVHFRGRPQDTRGLKAKLAGLGIAKPIMRSKEKAQ